MGSCRSTLTGGSKQRDSKNFSEGVFLSGTQTSDSNLGLELQRSDTTNLCGASVSNSLRGVRAACVVMHSLPTRGTKAIRSIWNCIIHWGKN